MISIAPSILSADFAHLGREIESVKSGGADLLHLDVMDGHFVPNITIGPPVISSIRKLTDLPLDVHLMIEEPARYLDMVIDAGANMVSVHVEAEVHLDRTVHHIQSRGSLAGVALNPATPIGALEEILPVADYVLVMSVNPGFGGQEFIRSALQKIRKLREIITSYKYRARIEIDGGVGPENLDEVLGAGAEMIVAGSAIFKSDKGPLEAARTMKSIAERYSRAPGLV